MSLDFLVKGGERVKHYGKYSAKSVFGASTALFKIPTNSMRKIREGRKSHSFLEQVIDDSTYTVIPLMEISAMSLEPSLIVPFAIGNGFSLSYEIHKAVKRRKEERASLEEGDLESGKSGFSFGDFAATALAVTLLPVALPVYLTYKAVKGVPQLPRKLVDRGKALPGGLARYAASYALLGSLALAHNSLPRGEENFDFNDINARIRKCELEIDGESREFFVLGEVHYYNKSSSDFVQAFVENNNVDVLLSEGVSNPDQQGLSEKLLFCGLRSFISGAGLDTSPGPREIFEGKEIPIVYLERYQSNGIREGVSWVENTGLGAMGVVSMGMAPHLYFASLPVRYLSLDGLTDVASGAEKGPLLTERNKIMVSRVFDYMENNPEDVPLIRVGEAHVKGVFSLLEDRGRLSYSVVDPHEVMEN